MAKIVYNRSTKAFAYKDYEGLSESQARGLAFERKLLSRELRQRKNYRNDELRHKLCLALDKEVKDKIGGFYGSNDFFKDKNKLLNDINKSDLDSTKKSNASDSVNEFYKTRDFIHENLLNNSMNDAYKAKVDANGRFRSNKTVHKYNPVLDKSTVQYKG